MTGPRAAWAWALAAGALVATGLAVRTTTSREPPAIHGVWRLVSRTIPATTAPGTRVDPFAHLPPGVQTDVQPGLLIVTARHFC